MPTLCLKTKRKINILKHAQKNSYPLSTMCEALHLCFTAFFYLMRMFGLSHLVLTSTLKRSYTFLHFMGEETKVWQVSGFINDRARIEIQICPIPKTIDNLEGRFQKEPQGPHWAPKTLYQHQHSFIINSDQGEKPDQNSWIKIPGWGRGAVNRECKGSDTSGRGVV